MSGQQFTQAGMQFEEGMTSAAIEKAKREWMSHLDKQLDQEIRRIDMRVKHEVEQLKAKNEQQKMVFVMHTDMTTGTKVGFRTKAGETEKMEMRNLCQHQKANLENQYIRIVMEYDKKTAEETIQKTQRDMDNKAQELEREYQNTVKTLASATSEAGTHHGVFALPTPIGVPQIRAANVQGLQNIGQNASRINLLTLRQAQAQSQQAQLSK